MIFGDSNNSLLEVLLAEAINTSAIEGKILQKSSVRSSINKLLKLGLEDNYSYTVQSDSLIEVIIDVKTNKEPLTKKRLLSWHNALFPTGSSGLRNISIGAYRTDKEAMLAHLYFALIHPFDDGNGRIARAITDYVLAQSNLANANFYSISTLIYQKRKEYYEILDIVYKNTDQDINLWIQWMSKVFENSMDDTLLKVEGPKNLKEV